MEYARCLPPRTPPQARMLCRPTAPTSSRRRSDRVVVGPDTERHDRFRRGRPSDREHTDGGAYGDATGRSSGLGHPRCSTESRVASSVSRQVIVTGGRLSPLPPSSSVRLGLRRSRCPAPRADACARRESQRPPGRRRARSRSLSRAPRHPILGRRPRVAVPWRAGPEGSVVPAESRFPFRAGTLGRSSGSLPRLQARQEPACADRGAGFGHQPPAQSPADAGGSRQVGSIDFVATTLPGLRGVHSVCGAVVEASFPFGPASDR